MPVMVLFSSSTDNPVCDSQKETGKIACPTLSIVVINRRANKRGQHKDVLGKVTLIHGIDLARPHRGHLEILESFSVPALTKGKQRVDSFDSLHAAWEEIFNVELLNKKFYRELSNWYFWAMHNCHFPYLNPETDKYDLFKDKEKVREHDAKNLIRLLTRILFV
jgi:adenine-specific DNA-methyltransferase